MTLNASVSDATSGLSYFESSLDNATWTPQTSPLTLNFSDGTRTVYLHAVDRAGNIERRQYEIKVDTQDPQLSETFTGTSGSNSWYISDVQVAVTESDPFPSSGIQYFAYSKDGGTTWTDYTTPFTLTEGVYDLQMHLVDYADNQDMKSQAIKVDTTAPSISGSLDQIPNALGWINAAVNLSASASDSTSGIASFESSLDNATWTAQSSPLTLNFSDGTYTVYLRAIDNAGHEYLLTQEIKVDSQEPVLSHQILGTLGENSWYTSDIQVEVTQVDPAPSSGIQSFQTSLDGTNWTDYSAPLNFSEGTYVLQMRVIDNADHQDLDGIPLNVDITPPNIDATLSGTLGSNNIYISPVEAAVSVSDNLSGIAATEYTLNGSGWQPYNSQLTLDGGVYALQFRTKDTAGLVSTTQVYDFSVDTHGPNIKLPSRWYIWETGDLFVKDEGSGIASVSYEIRDREGRWKKVEQSWDLNQEIFTHEIAWNRVFADGTLAPDGEYPIRVTATDHAGHSSQKTALIIVPPANATLLPTFTATPTQTQTPSPTPTAMETQSLATATAMPTMTSTPFVFVPASPTPTEKSSGSFFGFGNPPQQPDTDPQSPNPLIGITAAAVTGAYIATQRKKEVEFGSAPKEAKQAPAVPNVFDGAQATALMSAFTAKMEEERQRRIAEKAKRAEEAERQNVLHYQAVQERIRQIARAREEARRRREEAKRKAAVNPLQALWDANGAAIYEANQAFKTAYGKNMSASVRRKAIKDATVNGHFNAGAYAGNLVVKELERQIQAASSGGGGKPLYSPAPQGGGDEWPSEANKPWIRNPPWMEYWYPSNGEIRTKNQFGQDLISAATEDEILISPFEAAMRTYIAAGINVQRTGANNGSDPFFDAKGPAQLSWIQLNTPYGKGYPEGCGKTEDKPECKGYGLGLPGTNPFTGNIATEGMRRRYQQVYDFCDQNKITCDTTDYFVMAGMANNGASFDLDDMQTVLAYHVVDGDINWRGYVSERQSNWGGNIEELLWSLKTGFRDYGSKYVLDEFYTEALKLKEEGYYLPPDLDTELIEDLIKRK